MLLNWYQNFWTFMDEINALEKFVRMPEVHFLNPNEFGRTRTIANVGSPWTYWRNLMSGVVSPADTMISGVSLADLVGQPARRDFGLFEQTSVAGFLASRLYNTQGAIGDAGRTLAEAFASPSYLSSARSYRSLIKYGARLPDPMMWLLAENTETAIFHPWEARLHHIAKNGKHVGKLEIRKLTRLDRLHVEDGRVTALGLSKLDASPSPEPVATEPVANPLEDLKVTDETKGILAEVILALPPKALGKLLSWEITECAPDLANVRRLHSEPMMSLDVYFKRRIPDVPKGITILLESLHALSFLDISQIWEHASGTTRLNVVASDCTTIADRLTIANKQGRKLIERHFLDELSRFLPFDPERDVGHCHLQTNVGEELFVNQVGSWKSRPSTTCDIPNLFIAGDYCKTFVDVVTVEGAVVSGLMAAEAIRRHHDIGPPIEIIQPDAYPVLTMGAFAAAQMPMAFVAKALSTADTVLRSAFGTMFPNG